MGNYEWGVENCAAYFYACCWALTFTLQFSVCLRALLRYLKTNPYALEHARC